MENKYEKKHLVINWNNTGYEFEVQPTKVEGKLIFEINMFDNHPRTIEYSYSNGWWMLSGNSIYTDILVGMGATIEKNYPELF